MVENLAKVLKFDSNPAMDGWLLEMWFFAVLRNEGLPVYDLSGRSVTWPGSSPVNFEVKKMTHETFDASPTWLRPYQWNQGGYDAVYVDKAEGLVRFVQVTRGKTHSFKIGFFYEFLFNLQQIDLDFEIEKLEILYLVPRKNVREFKVGAKDVTGQGLLAKFGWEKGQEWKEIRVYGIDGL